MSKNDSRPLSPHLQIYDLPMTAKLSVLHRGTGAALSAGMILLVIALVAAANGESSWNSMQGFLSSWFGYLVLFGFTATLYYHFCNGIRHLMWDMGKGLELSEVEKSGKVVMVATAVLTCVTWVIALL
ncbi:succinate dehydrogenase, cytochrome b556 subunit [Leucothrix pacifica]|uniref:Succinate dehydrogenase cytochrome b556 subunit n=1 Tax=Leucothrix pacifica TaxID=1247513 RepID=A0A317CD67_9GAMM|nr:succinate dehydrogenase, cytochrome b556 subunit [Leucothrix pacifica]PWQ94052.1 succinate dehydrogenase, cytochrome b556 subunit [Leucothrix pacifica]